MTGGYAVESSEATEITLKQCLGSSQAQNPEKTIFSACAVRVRFLSQIPNEVGSPVEKIPCN